MDTFLFFCLYVYLFDRSFWLNPCTFFLEDGVWTMENGGVSFFLHLKTRVKLSRGAEKEILGTSRR